MPVSVGESFIRNSVNETCRCFSCEAIHILCYWHFFVCVVLPAFMLFMCVIFFKCFEFVQHLPWPSLSFERNLNATSWLNKGNININNRVHLRFLGL